MRRTIEYGYWSAREWVKWAGARVSGVDEELLEGLAAYALEQEDREQRTCKMLASKWERIREKGRAYLAHETSSTDGGDIVVLLDDEEGAEENDEEEEVPDYEDEGDDEVID